MKKVGFITMQKHLNRQPNSVGSSRIRGEWLWRNWEEAEEYQIGGQYEILIFQKAYWRQMAQEFKGIKIFDITDPDWLDQREVSVFEMASYCDAVVCSSEALASYIRKLVTNKPVVVIPDRVDLGEVKEIKTKHEGVAKNVVWFGYSNNLKYIERTFDFLAKKGLFLTYISDESMILPSGNLQSRFIKYRYETINEEVIKHDFVIMPDILGSSVDLDGRLKYKSNNKVIQCWAWGMPVASTPEEIERFLSPLERQKESELRLKEVKEKYDILLSVNEYKQLIKELEVRRKI